MIKEFKVGDMVKIIDNPMNLPDPSSIGRFKVSEDLLSKTYIVREIRKNIKLSNLNGTASPNDWWYHHSWLKIADPIWLKQKKDK